ncbi:hypothetical protein AXF42_Ash018616 [Apostasia shenzhenica]|uniref:Ribonuclease H1 N-terminal domain-containing protein n=1 Tax=Apostasia shenzhenica TaxID=1088818 RepID=A0A2I0B1G5_9ASPA|nr:hypothetical protein AXF42_Ash018616 [Apostasia shenzhenica]
MHYLESRKRKAKDVINSPEPEDVPHDSFITSDYESSNTDHRLHPKIKISDDNKVRCGLRRITDYYRQKDTIIEKREAKQDEAAGVGLKECFERIRSIPNINSNGKAAVSQYIVDNESTRMLLVNMNDETLQRWVEFMVFYLVLEDRKRGVYNQWEDCHRQVYLYRGALYFKVATREEDERRLAKYVRNHSCSTTDDPRAFMGLSESTYNGEHSSSNEQVDVQLQLNLLTCYFAGLILARYYMGNK